MTWGKAILQWTRNAGDARRYLIDLNHRYALDGRDPASYGGISGVWVSSIVLFSQPNLSLERFVAVPRQSMSSEWTSTKYESEIDDLKLPLHRRSP